MDWLRNHPRARTLLLTGGGLVVGLLALAFVLAAVDRSSGDQAADPGTTPTAIATPSAGSPTAAPTDDSKSKETEALPPLPDTDDPDDYAAAVAAALFGMDYRDHDPAAHEHLFRQALWPQINAEAQDAIMSAISRRIPTPDMWEQLRSVKQTSTFTPDLVWEPRAGRDGREAKQWPPGVVMRTVSGTRTETWRDQVGETQTTRTETVVTVTIVCEPSSAPCRLIGIQPSVES